MNGLTPIPDAWLNPAPNIDFVHPVHLPELTEADVSWNALNSLVLLVRRAETASFQAVSWRDRRVGAAAIAWDSAHTRMGILTGYNIKPLESREINIHAEQMVIEKVRRHKLDKIFAMAVWGEPEQDRISGMVSPTLHPCGLCRDKIAESPEIEPNIALLSGNADFSVCELYGLEELQTYHGTARASERPVLQRFTLADQALESRSYDEALGFFLLRKWVELNPLAPHAASLADWYERGQPVT